VVTEKVTLTDEDISPIKEHDGGLDTQNISRFQLSSRTNIYEKTKNNFRWSQRTDDNGISIGQQKQLAIEEG
jgi:hypothetical protein